MYGLKEAGFLSNLELKRVLAKEDYVSSKFTPGLFISKTRDIAFSLVVNGFCLKYTKKEDAEHLLKHFKPGMNVKQLETQIIIWVSHWNGIMTREHVNYQYQNM